MNNTTAPTTTAAATAATEKPTGSTLAEVTALIEAIEALATEPNATEYPTELRQFDSALRTMLGNHGGAIWGTQWTQSQQALRLLKPLLLQLPKPPAAKRGPKPKASVEVA